MKWLLALVAVAGVALVLWGPLPGVTAADRTWRAGGPEPILPMSFSHGDHGGVPCTTCHHTFIDENQGRGCVACHLTDAKVAHLFEEQFHTLCRSCHVTEHAAGKTSGPTRRCISCHIPDNQF